MTALDAGSAGIDPGRVAELLVTPAQPGRGRRGSGYRVSASAVLTAAHVVGDAALVQVRFDADRPGEWLTEGIVAWSDQATDVAVVTITPRPEDEEQVMPVGFGRLAERDAVLVCSAMGFPRFKLRKDSGQPMGDGSPSQYRDSVHAVGSVAVLSNRREGTFEVTVPPPERDPDPERSPWEGMSGAALWSHGRIIGLVAKHHPTDGLGRLAAVRIDRWYERLSRDQLDQLRTLLPSLPGQAAGLVDVIPPPPAKQLEAGYSAQLRAVVPSLDDQARSDLRLAFIRQVRHRIELLNIDASWHDERFTDLEVLTKVRRRSRWARWRDRRHGEPQTSRVLLLEALWSIAHAPGNNPLVVLEGDPGSGKSVALRHLAVELCRQAERGTQLTDVIPVYVDLRQLRPGQQQIGAELIHGLVLRTLGYDDSEDIRAFLDEQFGPARLRGQWLFLFDSFDEIPELLSATEPEDQIERYERALYDFLTTMSNCSGVVASREFRGPRKQHWPNLRIVPLSEERKHELVRQAGLDADDREVLFGGLPTADIGIQRLSGTPMFLGLVCEYVRREHEFPPTSYRVFDAYYSQRFDLDRDRLRALGVAPAEARDLAEKLAFAMTHEQALDLEPRCDELARAMVRLGLAGEDAAAKAMWALAAIHVAIIHDAEPDFDAAMRPLPEPPRFSFAHRRFQEYFATCFVLKNPGRVTPSQLLTDGRWREITVSFCQLQLDAPLAPLVRAANGFLARAIRRIGEVPGEDELADARTLPPDPDVQPFPWPRHLLHILGLLDAGLAGRTGSFVVPLRTKAGRLLLGATLHGPLPDRVWALDVAGVAPQPVLIRLLSDAFASGSHLLRDAAYRQLGRLETINSDIAQEIRWMLLSMFASRQLSRQQLTVTAQLRGLAQPQRFLDVQGLLLTVPRVDAVAHVGLLLLLLADAFTPWPPPERYLAFGIGVLGLLGLVALLHLCIYRVAEVMPRYGSGLPHSREALAGASAAIRALAPFTLALQFVGSFRWTTVAAVAVVLGICWGPMALIIVLFGEPVPRSHWPWLPAVLVRLILAKAWRQTRAQAVRLILKVGVLLSVVALFIYVLGPLFHTPPGSPRIPGWMKDQAVPIVVVVFSKIGAVVGFVVRLIHWPLEVILVVLLILLLMMLVASLVYSLAGALRRRRAWRRLRRRLRSPPSTLSLQETLEWLGQVHKERRAWAVLRVVRARALLRHDPEAPALRHLVAAIERVKRRPRSHDQGFRAELVEYLFAATRDPDLYQWGAQHLRDAVRAVRRRFTRATDRAHSTTAPVSTNPSKQGPATEMPTSGTTELGTLRVRSWIERATDSNGEEWLLILGSMRCLDEFGRIIEQVRPQGQKL